MNILQSVILLTSCCLAAACSGQQAVPIGGTPSSATQLGLSWRSEGASSLRLVNPDGSLRLRISCSAGERLLIVSVPSFTPVGSEDRLNLGIGSEPLTLAADPADQEAGQGVVAEGPIPPGLRDLLGQANQISASYGYQNLGPHVPPPPELAARFAAACDTIGRR